MLPAEAAKRTFRGAKPGPHPADKPLVLLTVAGFDPGSGAGITADLQTFAAHGCFGVAAITALTVQTTQGVRRSEPVSAGLIGETLAELERDFHPIGVKIGMLGSAAAVGAVAGWLRDRPSGAGPVVLDPVLRSSSGADLLTPEGMSRLTADLLPLVDWLTPNAAEAEALGGVDGIRARWPRLHLVVTGGDGDNIDRLYLPGSTAALLAIHGERIETTSTHGTGCAFSSALLAHLVRSLPPEEAVRAAKRFVEGALRHAPGLGHGHGPLGLLWPLRS